MVSPITRPRLGGGAWGCDEFMVGPGKSDTHCEVLCEREGSGAACQAARGREAGACGGQASAVRRGGQEERGHKAGGAWKHV